jgi:nucleotide-binding universal stress UspA family protein
MYKTILLTLDGSPADRPIVDHIKRLAGIMRSQVILLHIATGAPVQVHGADAAGEEIERSRSYLDQTRAEFESSGIPAAAQMGYGKPAKEIVRWVKEGNCDLVAMGTHGHKLLADLILGTTATQVQHNISVPVLLLRAR